MNKSNVLILVIVFVVLFTSPWWLNFVSGEKTPPPDLTYPDKIYGEECVMDVKYMTANHMDLLNEWRDKVVRGDERFFEFQGKQWEMSLTNTCMKCHSDKVNFCDKCHDYVDVNPYCWDCHVTPEEGTVIDIEPSPCCEKKPYKHDNYHGSKECCDSLKKECSEKMTADCMKKCEGMTKEDCMKKCSDNAMANCAKKCPDATADCLKKCSEASKKAKEVK
jgi:[DsrC]-trisulfide reductase subunit J